MSRALTPCVLGLEDDEAETEAVPQIQVGVTPKVGQGLAFFFAHVVAVGFADLCHSLPP